MPKDDLATALDGLAPADSGQRLRVDVIREDLDDVARASFDRALRDPKRVSANALASLMSKAGYRLSAAAVRTWRDKNLSPTEGS